MYTDPIADYLTRIRNAAKAGHKVVSIPSSNTKKEITKILKDKGFEVTGAFMKNWEDDDGTPYCSVKEDFFDAARVCDKLGIELIQLNFAKEYKEKVFEYFLNSLKNGKTPNPDIFCNKFIKFDAFFDYAIKNNFDQIATGHYCQIEQKDSSYLLKKSYDQSKDQT